jgi:hypothetical protein
MISLESRLVGARRHFVALDEASRNTQFIRNPTPQQTVVCKPAR